VRLPFDEYSSKLAGMNNKFDAMPTTQDDQIVARALERCGGNVRALARVLDVNHMRVYQWIYRRRLAMPWRLHLSSLLDDPAWPPSDKLAPVRRSVPHDAP
jgi:hypothetical protein